MERAGSAIQLRGRILLEFLALLAITYLSARHGHEESYFRRALVWVGGLAILPLCIIVSSGEHQHFWNRSLPQLPFFLHAAGFAMAFLLPLLAAVLLRGKGALWNLGYGVWVYVVSHLDGHVLAQNLSIYALAALASIGLVMWGLKENRRERINLGIAGFAITIIVFYFSTVMGKLGRSASLIAFGILFLVGGWQLEKLRRKLVARTRFSTVGEAP